MGKVRRKKPLKKQPCDVEQNETSVMPETTISEEMCRGKQFDTMSLPDNLLRKLNTEQTNLLTQNLPDFDARSAVTSKTFKGLNIKKRDKLKIKHAVFMQKIESLKMAKKKEKSRKRRKHTPIVGDLSLMEDALPTLELLMKQGSKSSRANQPRKIRGIEKETRRKKQMVSDLNIFRQVIAHPAFQENPTGTISEHLHNKMKQDDTMEITAT